MKRNRSTPNSKNLGRTVALDCDGVDFFRGDRVKRIVFTESVPALTALLAAIDDLLQRAIA